MTQETKEIFSRIDKIKLFWFVDNCYFVGRLTPEYYLDNSSILIITPRYGNGIMRFEVDKCPITGDLNFKGTIDRAIRYLNPLRVFYLNVKTFFVGLTYML